MLRVTSGVAHLLAQIQASHMCGGICVVSDRIASRAGIYLGV